MCKLCRKLKTYPDFLELDGEVWKWIDILGSSNRYQVSNLGRIRSLRCKFNEKSFVLKKLQENNGYLQCLATCNYKHKLINVHRIVAKYFIPHIEKRPHINHIDKNRKNNNVNNLEWVSQRENNTFAHLSDTHHIGVYLVKSGNFRVRIWVDGKNLTIGTFKNKEDAILAYKNKLTELKLINKFINV